MRKCFYAFIIMAVFLGIFGADAHAQDKPDAACQLFSGLLKVSASMADMNARSGATSEEKLRTFEEKLRSVKSRRVRGKRFYPPLFKGRPGGVV